MGLTSKEIVSVIIVAGGKNGYLESCLVSVKDQTYPSIETIVIDNSLDNNFSQGVIKRYSGLKLYPQEQDISYCQALNLGLKQSTGEFALCLNDDVVLEKEFIEKALNGFFIDPKVGMVSGKILRADKQTIDSAGLFLSLYRTAKERGYGVKDRGQFEKEEYIFGVNGAVAFYRKEMLEAVKEKGGYFDPCFRFFYEDLDIAWRAQRIGWRGYYVPYAVAYHKRGATARKNRGIGKPFARRYLSDELHFDLIKNRYLCMVKNESCPGFLSHFPCIFLYDFIMWSYILLFRPQLIKYFRRLVSILVDKTKDREGAKK
ncbi:MAG: glycosyltransferase [Candidatus Omnitrophota bacterium]